MFYRELCLKFSDDQRMAYSHQICNVYLCKSLIDERNVGLYYGRCPVDGCDYLVRKHHACPWRLGGDVQIA